MVHRWEGGVAWLRVDGVAHPDLDAALTPTEEDAYQVEFSARLAVGWRPQPSADERYSAPDHRAHEEAMR
mgnify:CR=1 FL=1